MSEPTEGAEAGQVSGVERCYVGLDMSLSSTGFCRMQGQKMAVETIKTDPKNFPCDLERLRHISDEVMRRIPVDVAMVCIEDFFTPQNPFQIGAAIGLAMLGATVRMALFEAGMPFFVIAPGQLKKFATGKGAGQKSIVVREVYKRWGLDVKDDNQADACVLAHIAEALCQEDRSGWPKYQTDVVETVLEERPRYNVPGSPSGKVPKKK